MEPVAASSVAASSTAVVVPAQLPALPPGFVGRGDHLAVLDALLDDPAPAIVTGLGGIGKTSLVVRWAHRRIDQFPDGQLFIDMRGYDTLSPLSPLDGLQRFLRALGVRREALPDDLDEAAALYRSMIHSRRMLVVVDNARTVDQVRPLLPPGEGNTVVVTSRHVLAGLVAVDGARPLPLDILGVNESRELLERLVGVTRLNADPDATGRLVELCGRLPLALRIVAAHLATNPAASIGDTVDHLSSADRLRRLSLPDDDRSVVADSIAMSFRVLDAQTRRFFDYLGLISAPEFADSLAAAAADLDDAEAVLSRLAAAHLVDRLGDNRSRVHDLVHLYLRERSAVLTAEDRSAAVERILRWWYDAPIVIDVDGRKAAVLDHRDSPQVWLAAQGLSADVHAGRDMAEIRAMAGLALDAAERGGDVDGQSHMHNLIAGTHWAAGEVDAAVACGGLALSTARRTGDDALISRHLSNMAVYAQLRGDQTHAHELMIEAIAISRRSGAGRSIISRMTEMSALCTTLGRYDEADAYLTEAAEMLQPEWILQRGSVCVNRAILCLAQGRYVEGLDWTAQALALREYPQRFIALIHRARLFLGCGRTADAGDVIAHIVADFPDSPHEMFLDLMAQYCTDIGDHDSALRHADELLDAARVKGTDYYQAHAELRYATVRGARGEHAEAIPVAVSAEGRFARMDEPLRRARCLALLAESYGVLGDTERAATAARRSVALFESLGSAEHRTIRALSN